jgi:hypothetical protein
MAQTILAGINRNNSITEEMYIKECKQGEAFLIKIRSIATINIKENPDNILKLVRNE